MVGSGLTNWVDISQILFNVLVGGAAVGAATKYIFLAGGHTELDLELRPLSRSSEGVTVEASIRIDNKSIRRFKFYNIFLHASAVNGSKPNWNWSSENLVEPHEKFVWLSANTGITIYCLLNLPQEVDVIDVELVVPYLQRRLKSPVKSAEAAKLSYFNSKRRYFSATEA